MESTATQALTAAQRAAIRTTAAHKLLAILADQFDDITEQVLGAVDDALHPLEFDDDGAHHVAAAAQDVLDDVTGLLERIRDERDVIVSRSGC